MATNSRETKCQKIVGRQKKTTNGNYSSNSRNNKIDKPKIILMKKGSEFTWFIISDSNDSISEIELIIENLDKDVTKIYNALKSKYGSRNVIMCAENCSSCNVSKTCPDSNFQTEFELNLKSGSCFV
jgi:hypothetical protein